MIKDEVLGILEGEYGIYQGSAELEFGGRVWTVDLNVCTDESEDISLQREAYRQFTAEWPQLQEKALDALLDYYKGERFSYGSEEDFESWWPEIDTAEKMADALTPETIVIQFDWEEEDNRRVFLLFSRAWGGPDPDDNGVAVEFVNETVSGVGYKDIAF